MTEKMCAEHVSPRVAKMARRIVLMFQLYREKINPENKSFLEFVNSYLKRNNVSDTDSIPYLELYTCVRSAIREYIKSSKKE